MKFLMLIKHDESFRSQEIPQALLDAMGRFVTESFQSGILKDTAGLKSTAEGFRVRSAGGKLQLTDGPFAEAKEIVGGYAMVDVPTRERAVEVAREFMEIHRVNWPEFEGECEVRPLEDMPG
ncbi:MAG: YciI family protein [Gemmatimonadales bacterium]